jgi:predicted dehydrogenase
LNAKQYTDYKLLIDEQNPDLISIATESGNHAEIALYCIDKGIPVIIEKPVALRMVDANEIIKRSEKKRVKVSACHQNRFNSAIQELRKAIVGGRFGRISHGSVNIRWNRGKPYYDQALWRGPWANDGGTLMNQCTHGIDLLRWMLGDEIEEVFGVTRRHFHDYIEAEDLGMALVKFRSGAIATIEGSVNIYPKNLEETLCVFGETGTVKIGGTSVNAIDVWEFADKTEEDANMKGLVEETNNVYGNGHTRLFADMIDAIKNDRKPYVDAYAGRDALELILAIYKSMKTGLPVKLPLNDFSALDMKGTF